MDLCTVEDLVPAGLATWRPGDARLLGLGAELGFDAVDTGALSNARYLEPAVELLIQLGFGQGMGTGIGFSLARA